MWLTFSLHFNNNGPLIFTLQVEIMKENLLVILFLSIQCSPSTSLSGLSILNSASNKVGYLNSGLGMISRSKNVNAASQMLRGEDDAAVRESLAQAVTTLAVLDIGGGALVPVTQHIIDTITTDSAFKATRDAWGVYREGLEETFKQNFKRLPESAVKRLLTNKKNQVLNAFETDLGKVHNIPKYSKTMKYINRAKRWFRAKPQPKYWDPCLIASELESIHGLYTRRSETATIILGLAIKEPLPRLPLELFLVLLAWESSSLPLLSHHQCQQSLVQLVRLYRSHLQYAQR